MLGLLFAWALASAEPPAVRRYDFDADEVRADIVDPTGELTSGVRPAARGQLLHPRTSFLSELVRSADDR